MKQPLLLLLVAGGGEGGGGGFAHRFELRLAAHDGDPANFPTEHTSPLANASAGINSNSQ